MTTVRGLVMLYATLLVLVGAQAVFGLTRFGAVTMPLGMAMAMCVAFGFMRVGSAIPISRVFALAGLFWLSVLFGLTATDVLFRVSSPNEMHSEP